MHAVFYTKPRAFCTCEQGTPGGGPELPCGWGGVGRQYDAAAGLPPSDGVGGRGAPVPRCRRAAAAGRLPPLINCRNGQGGRRPLRAPLAKAPSESNQYCERGGGLATPPCPRQERRRPAPHRKERCLRARTRSRLESEVWCGGFNLRRPLRDIRQPPPGAPIFSPAAGRVGCRHPVAPLLACALPATFFVAQKALVLVQRTPMALLCHLPAQLTSGTLSSRLPTRASCHLRKAAPDDKPKLSPHCHR